MGTSCSTQSKGEDVSQPQEAVTSKLSSETSSRSDNTREDVEPHAPPANYRKHRRTSVSAEASAMSLSMPAVQIPKSEDVQNRIKAALQHSFVFKGYTIVCIQAQKFASYEGFFAFFVGLDEEQEQAIIDCMFARTVTAAEMIIREGEEGDNCYVVESGTYVATKGDKQIYQYESCGAFGELALLYNCPRAASVQATSEGVLWCVDRARFRKIMIASTAAKRERFERTLQDIPLFDSLSAEQRAVIADCLEAESYNIGDYVLQEGDPIGSDAKFYLVQSGMVRCLKSYEGDKQPVADVGAGGYFGELGLVTNAPRAADCVVGTDKANLLSMGREAFQRLMGPVEGVLAEKVQEYVSVNQQQQSSGSRKVDIAAAGS